MKPSSIFIPALVCIAFQPVYAGIFGKFTYSESAAGVTITDYPENAAGPVTIPTQIAGKPVTSIGVEAFLNCRKVTSVTIPEGVTTLEDRAFYGCGLADISLPASLKSAGDGAFFRCAKLTKITLPDGVSSIGAGVFSHCTGLRQVRLPAGITRIEQAMFYLCSSLEGFEIPSSVTSLGPSAFTHSGLKTISIPSSVTLIGNNAFEHCDSLATIKLSEGLQSIGSRAFGGVEMISSITFPSTLLSLGKNAFQRRKGPLKAAVFLGNAPAIGADVFKTRHEATPPGFVIYYQEDSTGFTSPKWNGYTAIATKDGPSVRVEQPLGAALEDDVSKKGFGAILVGKTGGTKTFTIMNNGSAPLTGLKISIDGGGKNSFKVIQPNKTAVGIGQSRVFSVTFKPSSIGQQNAMLHVIATETSGDPFDIKVAGLGIGIR